MRIPFTRPLQIKRSGTGSYVNGRWVAGETEVIDIEGSPQPFSAREMLMMPGGNDSRERLKIYTTTPVFAQSETRNADIIVVDGVEWEVESVQNYNVPGYGIKHYKVIVMDREKAESA